MKGLEHGMYHSALRVSALVVAVVLLFQSGVLLPATSLLSQNTERYLANAVGISVGVAPTELNQITAALTEKERLLASREEAIAAREIEIGLSDGSAAQKIDTVTLVLAIVLFILLVLIVLNYVLDFLRATRMPSHVAQET